MFALLEERIRGGFVRPVDIRLESPAPGVGRREGLHPRHPGLERFELGTQ
jgi:hypothetical protein